MHARLIVEAGAASPPVLDLADGTEFQLGRNRACQMFLQDRHASRRHACLRQAEGAWLLADQGTTNGTRVDGRRIESAELADNQVIAIGDVRLRFRAGRAAEEPCVEPHVSLLGEDDSTRLDADELTALVRFAYASLNESSAQELAGRALAAIVRQTGASLAGLLTLDAEHPQMRVVRPEEAALDARLSRHLTESVLRLRKTVWLGETGCPRAPSESLSAFQDAICVPLRGAEAAWGQEGELPLGALHAYRASRPFTEQQARFCKIVAAVLATALEAMRSRRALEADNERLRDRAATACELVGSSKAIDGVRAQVRRLASGSGPVLLCGETGVGKELAAVGLHRQSPRHAGPLVVADCAALTEAGLFGSEGVPGGRGGFFAQADMGTLFLDEVCELSPDLQGKLLRAIETGFFRPANARSDRRADVRVVAATRRDPEQEMHEGRLRPELCYRLKTRILVPPLRERIGDLPELVQHFLEHLGREHRRTLSLSVAAQERLARYAWPGNVRQLRSVLEAAVANCGERPAIHAGDLCLHDPLEGTLPAMPATLNVEQLEQWAIRQAMRRTNDTVVAAAELLGMHRSTLYDKLKQYGP